MIHYVIGCLNCRRLYLFVKAKECWNIKRKGKKVLGHISQSAQICSVRKWAGTSNNLNPFSLLILNVSVSPIRPIKLHPSRSKWLTRPALISGSVVLSGWESVTPPGQDTSQLQIWLRVRVWERVRLFGTTKLTGNRKIVAGSNNLTVRLLHCLPQKLVVKSKIRYLSMSSASQASPQWVEAGTRSYSWVDWDRTSRVKCLAQGHNTVVYRPNMNTRHLDYESWN